MQQLVQIQGLQTRLWQSAEIAKLVDQALQSIHLIHDGFHRFMQQGLICAHQLIGQFHFQTLCRKLNRCQRVFNLVGQPARHLGPCLGALGRHDFRDVIKHQKPLALGQHRASRDQGGVQLSLRSKLHKSLLGLGVDFKRLLPMVQRALLLRRKLMEMLHDLPTKHLQTFDVGQRFAQMHRQRQLQNACGPWVDRQNMPLCVEQHHASGKVVEHGLQMAASQIDLRHARLYGSACLCQLLGHLRKSAGKTI